MSNPLNLREYGDLENIKTDSKNLTGIIERQGLKFVVDVIAEYIGTTVLKFKLSVPEVTTLVQTLIKDLANAISERT